MEVAPLGADRLGDLGDEGDHVVVGRLLDLGDPLRIDRRLCLDRGERLGRDLAASALGAGDGELDAEHLLEARLVRPERAHLGQRVAADHRPRPRPWPDRRRAAMSWRRCIPGHEIASAARSATARAAARSGPRPTTVRTRPPFVANPPPSSRRVPAWKTSAPVARAASMPSIASPRPRAAGIALRRRGRSRRPRRAGPAIRAPRAVVERAAGRRQQQRPERSRQPRQDHLRLRVAEPGVALEEPRPVGGEHQAGVEEAAERRPAPGQLRQQRPVERSRRSRRPRRRTGPEAASRRPCRRCSVPRRRRSSRLWSRAAGRATARSPSQIAMTLASRPRETLLDDDALDPRSVERRCDRARRPRRRRRTTTPLPAARPSALTTTPSPPAACSRAYALSRGRIVERRRAGPSATPAASATSWQKAFDDSIRAAAAVGPNVAMPASRSASATPAASGASGPITTSSTASRRGERRRSRRRRARSTRRRDPDARLLADRVRSGSDHDLVDAGLGGELPGEGVLASAAADDEDPGRHDRRLIGRPRSRGLRPAAGRLRIGRQARSIVWVRSGPTETRTIGTPACSSSADR